MKRFRRGFGKGGETEFMYHSLEPLGFSYTTDSVIMDETEQEQVGCDFHQILKRGEYIDF